MNNDFLQKYIEQLIKYCKVPKFQNERALSMMLSLYLERIISEITGDRYKLITIELPIAKEETNHSTNVDYCLINEKQDIILLAELKTERQGNNTHFWKQMEEYQKLKNIGFLQKQFEKCLTANKNREKTHKEKYDFLSNLINGRIDSAKSVKVMYIVPDKMLSVELKEDEERAKFLDYKVSFSELLNIRIDEDFELIKKYLKELNL